MWSRMASARSSLFDISRTFIDTSRPRRFAMRHSGGHPLGVPWSQGGTVNLVGRERNERSCPRAWCRNFGFIPRCGWFGR
jgi:hypothetical protein